MKLLVPNLNTFFDFPPLCKQIVYVDITNICEIAVKNDVLKLLHSDLTSRIENTIENYSHSMTLEEKLINFTKRRRKH